MQTDDCTNIGTLSDRALCRKAQAGDLSAVDKLIRRHVAYLTKMASGFEIKGADFDDIYSVVTIGFYKAAQKYDLRSRNTLLTYATRVIHGKVLNMIDHFEHPRSTKYRATLLLDDLSAGVQVCIDPIDPSHTPEQVCVDKDSAFRLRSRILDVPKSPAMDRNREVLLSLMQGDRHVDVGRRFGISKSNVGGLIKRTYDRVMFHD